jgi:phosphatidylglycerophosphatase A
MKKKIIELIATFFYVGYIPFIPGTAASIITTIAFFFLPDLSFQITIAVWMSIFIIGTWISGFMEQQLQILDAPCIVIDEVLGMSISLFLVPKSIFYYCLAFVIFRFFDIIKPFPVSFFEKQFNGGWGIMLDDVAAAAYTLIFMKLFLYFF